MKSSGSKKQKESWDLRLYVAGQTPKSIVALANLRKICAEHLKDEYHIEVIDLVRNPQLARQHQILAIPTLVRSLSDADQKNHRRSFQHRESFVRVGRAPEELKWLRTDREMARLKGPPVCVSSVYFWRVTALKTRSH